MKHVRLLLRSFLASFPYIALGFRCKQISLNLLFFLKHLLLLWVETPVSFHCSCGLFSMMIPRFDACLSRAGFSGRVSKKRCLNYSVKFPRVFSFLLCSLWTPNLGNLKQENTTASGLFLHLNFLQIWSVVPYFGLPSGRYQCSGGLTRWAGGWRAWATRRGRGIGLLQC